MLQNDRNIPIFIQQDRRLEPRANAIAFALVAAVRSATKKLVRCPSFCIREAPLAA